jgi:hypothetical protein
MIPLPRRVKVGPHVYRVLLKPARVMQADGEGVNGFCHFDKAEIWLFRGLKAAKRREFLLHELKHAAGHSAFHERKLMTEEAFVRHMAPAMLAMIRDNPALVAYLTQK